MSYPRIEYILQNIASELAEVTIANGWNQTLNVARRSRYRLTQGGRENHDTIIVPDDPIIDDSTPHQYMSWFAPVNIWYFAVTSDATEQLIDQQLFVGWADIVKKLREDPRRGTDGSGGTGAPYAIDTLIDQPQIVAEEAGKWEAINCRVRVHFRHDMNNPYLAS